MALPLIPATKEQEKQIYSALNIEEDRHCRMIQLFKDWVKTEPHLPCDVDDSYLSSVLLLSKDDLTKARKKYEGTIIGRKGQYCLSHDTFLPAEDLTKLNIPRYVVIIPKLTEDCYRVVYKSFPKSAETLDMSKFFKFWITLGDTILFEDKAAGVIAIADFANCNMEMMRKVDLLLCAKVATFCLQAYTMRLKNYHVINVPSVAKPIVAVIRAALPAKLKNRLIIHNDAKDLKNYLSEEYIPEDYGGTLTSLDNLAKLWETYYIENQEWKEKLSKLKLRGEVPKEKVHLDPTSGFGTDGSFRNLAVD